MKAQKDIRTGGGRRLRRKIVGGGRWLYAKKVVYRGKCSCRRRRGLKGESIVGAEVFFSRPRRGFCTRREGAMGV